MSTTTPESRSHHEAGLPPRLDPLGTRRWWCGGREAGRSAARRRERPVRRGPPPAPRSAGGGGRSGRRDLAGIYSLEGELCGATGDRARAVEAFRLALALHKGYQPRAGSSPRILEPFEEAKRRAGRPLSAQCDLRPERDGEVFISAGGGDGGGSAVRARAGPGASLGEPAADGGRALRRESRLCRDPLRAHGHLGGRLGESAGGDGRPRCAGAPASPAEPVVMEIEEPHRPAARQVYQRRASIWA